MYIAPFIWRQQLKFKETSFWDDEMDGKLLVLCLLLVFAGLYAGAYFLASGITPQA